jgi:hypothetical protein
VAEVLLVVLLVIGLVVGRWWVLLVALPLIYWAVYEVPIENSSPPYWEVGAVVGVLALAALSAGVYVRRRIRFPNRSDTD